MNVQTMVMIPAWRYDKMVESYDKALEELRELKEQLKEIEESKAQQKA